MEVQVKNNKASVKLLYLNTKNEKENKYTELHVSVLLKPKVTQILTEGPDKKLIKYLGIFFIKDHEAVIEKLSFDPRRNSIS